MLLKPELLGVLDGELNLRLHPSLAHRTCQRRAGHGERYECEYAARAATAEMTCMLVMRDMHVCDVGGNECRHALLLHTPCLLAYWPASVILPESGFTGQMQIS